MAEKEVAVKVENLTKTFRIPLEASSGIKQRLINMLKGRKGYRNFTPLNDISFEIEKGDFFGIVGRNGSGKSTLLKTIAGIYSPTSGGVHVNGSLVPFIELGVGFNPELTGRENVFLNGALLGFSHDQMEAMYGDIVDFAELGEFMDERLKNYSSGMQVRLAFSIAIRAQGDILVLDEILAVGDEAFQRKCNEYFQTLKRSEKTVVLVTHDMSAVRRFCNRAVYIRNGDIIIDGKPDEVASLYSQDNMKVSESAADVEQQEIVEKKEESIVSSLTVSPMKKQTFTSTENFVCDIEYEIIKNAAVNLTVALIDEQSGVIVFDDKMPGKRGGLVTSDKKGKYKFSYKVSLDGFNNRDFSFRVELVRMNPNGETEMINPVGNQNTCFFSVRGVNQERGLLSKKGEWA